MKKTDLEDLELIMRKAEDLAEEIICSSPLNCLKEYAHEIVEYMRSGILIIEKDKKNDG